MGHPHPPGAGGDRLGVARVRLHDAGVIRSLFFRLGAN